jgi:hypothetical protein
MLAALSRFDLGTMFAHSQEAAKARASHPSLLEGTSQRAGFGRRDHGLVGVGARDQRVAAAGPQVSVGFGSCRLSRKAQDKRWAPLLPRQFVATEKAEEFTKMSGKKHR